MRAALDVSFLLLQADCKSSDSLAEGQPFVCAGVALLLVHWVQFILGQLLLWEGGKTRAPYL